MSIPFVEVGDLEHPIPGSYKIGPFGSLLKKDELVSDGIPVIGIENVLDQSFSRPFRRYITEAKYEQLEQYLVRPSDILVTTMGTVGVATVVPDEIETMIFDSHLFRMRVDQNKVDPNYLCFALNGYSGIKQYLEQNSRGAIMDGLNTSILKECKLPLPPLETQRRIASVLSKSDRIRRMRRYALEISDSYLQGVFLEMFGDPNFNPKNFKLEEFDEVCVIDAEMVDPKQPEYRRLLHIGGANIESITGDLLNVRTVEEEGLISGKFLIEPHHVIFSKIRPKLRKVALPRMKALCSADIYPIRLRNGGSLEYLLWFLRGEYFSNLVSQIAESRSNIPKVNRDELTEILVMWPTLELQQHFAKIVRKHERLRAQQVEALRQAEHLYQTLLHQAFAG